MHSNVFSPHETGKSFHKLVPDIEFQSVKLYYISLSFKYPVAEFQPYFK